MSEVYTIKRDLGELEAMVKNLENYVRGDTLYGSAGGAGFFSGGRMPSLTVGAVLMRLRRLDVLHNQMDDAQIHRFEATQEKHAHVADEWRLHYTGKMTREANSRLDAMHAFFEECTTSPKLCANVYRPELLRRTIVQEILIAMDEINMAVEDDLKQKLNGTDGRLRQFVKPSEFQWAEQLQPAYDQKTFWWLYQQPPVVED